MARDKADEILDDLERERDGRIASYEAWYFSGPYPVREYPSGTFHVQIENAWMGPVNSEDEVEDLIERHELEHA